MTLDTLFKRGESGAHSYIVRQRIPRWDNAQSEAVRTQTSITMKREQVSIISPAVVCMRPKREKIFKVNFVNARDNFVCLNQISF